jgi:hypothetical protein
MDDRQYSVPAASPNRTNGSNGNFKALVSAIERSGITAAAADRAAGGRFDNLFAHRALAASGRPVPPRQIPLAPTTSLASWAPRCADTDIDTEILQWIVSHVQSRKRSQQH